MKTKAFDEGLYKKLLSEANTFATDKKKRVAKTKNNILLVKKTIQAQREELIQETLAKDHIQAILEIQTCSFCEKNNLSLRTLRIWLRSTKNPKETRPGDVIDSRGMFELYKHLPIEVKEHKVLIPICAGCLEKPNAKDH